jgi:hypothetical protein
MQLQRDWLIGERNKLAVEQLIHYERLDMELKTLLERWQIEPVTVTVAPAKLDDFIRQMPSEINKFIRRDNEQFNYHN